VRDLIPLFLSGSLGKAIDQINGSKIELNHSFLVVVFGSKDFYDL